MSTTDHAPLAEQIAREHIPVSGAWECSCSEWKSPYTEPRCRNRDHRAHIATVTERAVREWVAAQIEAKAVDLAADEMFSTSATSREAYLDGMDRAACIARGESDG